MFQLVLRQIDILNILNGDLHIGWWFRAVFDNAGQINHASFVHV